MKKKYKNRNYRKGVHLVCDIRFGWDKLFGREGRLSQVWRILTGKPVRLVSWVRSGDLVLLERVDDEEIEGEQK